MFATFLIAFNVLGSTTDATSIDLFGALSNVRFAVFALGSSAYPNFCNFGKYVDKLLCDLGGERIHEIAMGDEMCGQDQAFRKWASGVFNVSLRILHHNDKKETTEGFLKSFKLKETQIFFR